MVSRKCVSIFRLTMVISLYYCILENVSFEIQSGDMYVISEG